MLKIVERSAFAGNLKAEDLKELFQIQFIVTNRHSLVHIKLATLTGAFPSLRAPFFNVRCLKHWQKGPNRHFTQNWNIYLSFSILGLKIF